MEKLLSPFYIGDVKVEFPVILAALAGYSDLPFREICRKLGAPFCATEMMLDKSVLVGGKLTNRLAATNKDDHPVAGQLIGNDPQTMSQAAKTLDKRGFDVIDINFACPVRKALARHRGGFMMKCPDEIIEITKRVIEVVNRPVTLKLRKSFYQDDETCDDFWKIAQGVFDAGAAGICVHGRSVQSKYTGPADWEFLKKVKDHFRNKLVMGSGDVKTPRHAIDMLNQTGVDAVTAARGAMGNPWFFKQYMALAAGREISKPSLSEQREIMTEQFNKIIEFYGPRRGPMIMRKSSIRYATMHPFPKKMRIAFVAVQNEADWHKVLEEHYSE